MQCNKKSTQYQSNINGKYIDIKIKDKTLSYFVGIEVKTGKEMRYKYFTLI